MNQSWNKGEEKKSDIDFSVDHKSKFKLLQKSFSAVTNTEKASFLTEQFEFFIWTFFGGKDDKERIVLCPIYTSLFFLDKAVGTDRSVAPVVTLEPNL